MKVFVCKIFFFQAEDGIRDQPRSRGLGDVYKRQAPDFKPSQYLHAAEIHTSYLDPETTFNNLYAKEE